MSKQKFQDVSDWPVMKRQCATCPFRLKDGKPDPDTADIRARVEARILSEASQICHHPVTVGKKSTHLCRGARNLQLTVFYRLGFIEAPTDEAWKKRWEQVQKQKQK